TVVSLVGEVPTLLRLGATPREEIERELGRPLAVASPDAAIASPGQLATHYAPDTKLRLDATSVGPDEALLAFGKEVPKGAGVAINRSERGDLNEAAEKLFGALRALDQAGMSTIAVMPIPDRGLGEAINDRLRRASCSARPRRASDQP